MKKKDLETKIAERKQEAIDKKIIKHAYSLATDEYFSKCERKVLNDRVDLSYDFARQGMGIDIGNYVWGPFYLRISYGGQEVFNADFATSERNEISAFEPIKLKKYIPGEWTKLLEYTAINKDPIKVKEIAAKHAKIKKAKEEITASHEQMKAAYESFGISEEE